MPTIRHSNARRSAGTALLLACLAAGCAQLTPGGASGGIRGRVLLDGPERASSSRSPLVVTATPQRRSWHRKSTSTVVLCEGAFSPSFLVVRPGQRVRFENGEDICHGVFSSSKQLAFDLGTVDPGKTSSVRLREPGIAHVYCSLHGGEKATILVTPAPFYETVDGDGEFEFASLPAGPCVLETWSADRPQRRVEVIVPRNGSTFAELPLDEPRE